MRQDSYATATAIIHVTLKRITSDSSSYCLRHLVLIVHYTAVSNGSTKLRSNSTWKLYSGQLPIHYPKSPRHEKDPAVPVIIEVRDVDTGECADTTLWFRPLLKFLDNSKTYEFDDVRDRTNAMLILMGVDATLMDDYSITPAQLYATFLDARMIGKAH